MTSPDRRPWGVVDGLLLLAAGVLGAKLWGDCVAGSEVAGDSFVPLLCGLRFLQDGWAMPSQNIFGWGLCASYAPLFVGVESIAEVAWRRGLLQSLLVPAAFITARNVLAEVRGLGLPALRFGAAAAAVAVAYAPGVGIPSSSGGHGYLSWVWIALGVAAFSVALRAVDPDRPGGPERLLAALFGGIAVPMAAMNHPFAAWFAASTLALVPLAVARLGVAGTVAGVVGAGAAAGPQVVYLAGRYAEGDRWSTFANQPGSRRLLEPELLRAWLADGPDAVPLLGFAACLVVLPWFVRGVARAWAAAALVGAVAVVALGVRVGYLQSYHVLTLHPFAAIGVGLLAAGGAQAATSVPLRGLSRWVVGLPLGAFALGMLAEVSDLDEQYRDDRDPWCSFHPADGGTAAGVARNADRVLADLQTSGLDQFLLTDLNLSERTVDGSVVLALDLHLSGVPAEAMSCCEREEWAPWYMVADLGDPRMNWTAVERIDGIDVLERRTDVSELLFAVRTPDALAALGAVLCDSIPTKPPVRVHYYAEIMATLRPDWTPPVAPPSPTPPCLTRTQ